MRFWETFYHVLSKNIGDNSRDSGVTIICAIWCSGGADQNRVNYVEFSAGLDTVYWRLFLNVTFLCLGLLYRFSKSFLGRGIFTK